MSSKHDTVLILDYGSQYTQLIARRVRELGVYAIVLGSDVTRAEFEALQPKAVILSGGPASVYDSAAPKLPGFFWEAKKNLDFSVLGICYGMQLIAQTLGGKVTRAQASEYGRMKITEFNQSAQEANLRSKLFLKTSIQRGISVWMSHGDEVSELPSGFRILAKSDAHGLAAIEKEDEKIYGLQFHPEVVHSEEGETILKNFIFGVSSIQADWTMATIIDDQVAKILKLVGPDDHVICALSGGVDSAVAATLVHRALGSRLHCVFVDHGMLRFQEAKRVLDLFKSKLHLPITLVEAQDRFLNLLQGVSDPETKRKIIGSEFIRVFEDEAKLLEITIKKPIKFLVQGTLYPDVIESSPSFDSKKKNSVTIKSHHNVGGLPKDLKFILIEPLRELFKDEVRKLGAELGVQKDFLERHPFPGPGLAVRILGEITAENIKTLQLVDEVFISEIQKWGLYPKIWQAFAVFLPIKSVGVKGDSRTHHNVIALRAVTSVDGMTADWYPFDSKFLAVVSNRISNEVPGVGRVVYDISSKPPATIEWE